MIDQWLYFGCHRQPGHFLFREGMSKYGVPRTCDKLSHFDGKLPRQDSTEPYIATVSRLEGWGGSALAFWDYSVDKRGGCNSVVFAPSMTIAPADLLAEAQARFPEVFNRTPHPVRLFMQQPKGGAA